MDSMLWQRFSRFPGTSVSLTVLPSPQSDKRERLYPRHFPPTPAPQSLLADLHMKLASLVSRSLPAQVLGPVASPAGSPSRIPAEYSSAAFSGRGQPTLR